MATTISPSLNGTAIQFKEDQSNIDEVIDFIDEGAWFEAATEDEKASINIALPNGYTRFIHATDYVTKTPRSIKVWAESDFLDLFSL